MKTRIKVEELYNGEKLYYPQYKWNFFYPWDDISSWTGSPFGKDAPYSNFDKAKEQVLRFQEHIKNLETKHLGERVLKTTYIKTDQVSNNGVVEETSFE